jgi:hypothetical protein
MNKHKARTPYTIHINNAQELFTIVLFTGWGDVVTVSVCLLREKKRKKKFIAESKQIIF